MSMGKSWNKLGRKGHRHERSQPAGRQHLGFLEHHSDYSLRAKDYHKKQDELAHLRLLASMKNPDEFHSNMVHTKAEDGRLWHDSGESKMSKSKLKIFRDADHKFVTMQMQHQRKKLKRELGSFHCTDASNLVNYQKGDDKMEIIESSNVGKTKSDELLTIDTKAKRKSDHIIFVDSNKERLAFKGSTYFGTPRELLTQKHNRLRTEQLAQKQIKIDPLLASKLKKQTLLKYWQIQGRINKMDRITLHHETV